MSEITRDFRAVTPIQNYNPQHMASPEYAGMALRCEDCPAADVCKKINNFRSSCDPKSGKKLSQADLPEKCVAGTNILLSKILEALSRGR